MNKTDKPNSNPLENYTKYSSIALQMAVIIGLGVFGGVRLDQWINWKIPVFTVILSLASVTLAIYYVVRDLIGKK